MSKIQFFTKSESFTNTQQEIDTLLKDNGARKLLKWCLTLIFIFIAGMVISYIYLPPYIPLFFSLPWGEEQLVSKNWFASIPMLVSVLFFVNLRFASIFYTQQRLLSQVILWGQIMISLLSIIACFRIIFLFI